MGAPSPAVAAAGRLAERAGVPGGVAGLTALVALSAAVVAQGGYHRPARILVTALSVTAVVLTLPACRRLPRRLWPVIGASAALAAWAVVRGLLAGDAAAALPWLATLACLLAGMIVAWRSGDRLPLASAMVLVGSLLAVTAWLGLVWRVRPWAAPIVGVWRGTGPVSYANATAALLAMLGLLAMGLLVAQPRSVPRISAAYLVTVGLGATASRGGAVTFVVGLAVLVLLGGVRRVTSAAAPVLLGAALAVSSLVPSLPAAAAGHAPLASAGLVAGWAVAVTARSRRARVALLAAGLAALISAGVLLASGRSADLGPVTADRLTTSSWLRSEATGSAVRLVAATPLLGVGPGRALFTWPLPGGNVAVTWYVHDEYLQLQVELGAVGSALLLALLVTLWLAVLPGRAGHRPAAGDPAPLWPAAVAGLSAFLVHSGADFLWHLPAVIVCAGLLAGLACPPWDPPTGAVPSREEL